MNAIFTTSWDDGGPEDLRMVRLLDKYGLKGTFYVTCMRLKWKNVNLNDYAKTVCENHEIGSHLIHHTDLTALSPSAAFHELSESKQMLESIHARVRVQMLSYPWGKYNEEIKELAKKAGYIGARTTNVKPPAFPKDPYELPVTFGVWGKWKSTWQTNITHARKMLTALSENGGVFHLTGHCWELELDQTKWRILEKFFGIVSETPNLTFLTNSEVVKWIDKL